MATRKPLFFGAYGSEEMASADDIALGGLTMSADIVMAGNEVTGLPSTPSSATSAVSKQYADSLITNSELKGSVKAGTTGALPAYTASGSGEGKTLTADANGAWATGDSDGVTLVVTDRFLVKDENAGGADIDHGIYTLTQLGDAGNPWILTRATDFDLDAEVNAGAYTWVSEGTTQDNTTWAIITNDPITVDTTPIDFTQTQGAGAFSAGDGIEINSGVIAVDLEATSPGLEFSGGDLQVKLNGTTLAKAAGGLSVLGVPTQFEINGVATSVNVTSANLGTLVAGGASDADSLHTHPSLGAPDTLRGEATANENLAKGDPIEWGGANDELQKCQASALAKIDCIGVVEEALGITASSDGTIVYQGSASNVLVGATVGDRFYVGDTGGLVNGFGAISAGNHVILVGTAKNATDLHVQPQYITRKAS